jgi:hypothetical protein
MRCAMRSAFPAYSALCTQPALCTMRYVRVGGCPVPTEPTSVLPVCVIAVAGHAHPCFSKGPKIAPFPTRHPLVTVCVVGLLQENEAVVAAVLPSAAEHGFTLVLALPSWPRRGLSLPPGRGEGGADGGGGGAGAGAVCAALSLSPADAEKVVRVDPAVDRTNGFFVALFERAPPRVAAAVSAPPSVARAAPSHTERFSVSGAGAGASTAGEGGVDQPGATAGSPAAAVPAIVGADAAMHTGGLSARLQKKRLRKKLRRDEARQRQQDLVVASVGGVAARGEDADADVEAASGVGSGAVGAGAADPDIACAAHAAAADNNHAGGSGSHGKRRRRA